MSWYGDWNLEYIGKNNEKFVNTAKLVIPNFKKRFEISNGKDELESIRRLSWYSADMDIEKILSYLEDGDQIHVLIDGETHPIREVISEGGYVDKGTADENNYDYITKNLTTGKITYHSNEEYIEPEYDYCECEDQTYKKENGKVTMECEYSDDDRYKSDMYGMKEDFIYELAYSEQAKKETLEGGDIDTLDAYIEWIAQEMGDDEEMLPIIQDFMNEIMNISRDDVVKENGKINEEAFAYFNTVKAKFKSLESTKEYLSQIKEKLPPKEKEEKMVLPDLFANMSKKDINQLGGKEQVIKLYEKEGEQKTRELLSILGYDLNSGLKENRKKQSLITKKREKNEVNQKIKQSVIDYFLGCVKHKYPNITSRNEEKFSKALGEYVDLKLERYDSYLNIDYDPCQELSLAFYSMDMSDFDSGYPIYDVFPSKTSVEMKSGKCATVSSEYGKSEILYMTDEYRQDLLTSVNTRIMKEEAKIPQEVKDGFEQEYENEMKTLAIKREPLIKKQEETQRILEQEKEVEFKAQQLIESYSTRISELETLGLSEKEKLQRKRDIIKEIKKMQGVANSNKFREQLDKIEEKYGWENLKEFDEEHKDSFDKEKWLRRKNIQYARKEHDRIWEEYKKEHPNDLEWPDTSSVPYDLETLYLQKDEIAEYDREQEKKAKEQGQESVSKEQQKFIEALGNTYADYMEKHGDIDELSFRNDRKLILADGFSKYFASNYNNLTNSAFLVEFENGPMRDIAKQRGFRISSSAFGWGFNAPTDIAHVNVSNGLIYYVDGLLDQAKIEYATPEAIQQQINKFNSEILFMQDTGENAWNVRKIEKQRDSFVSYQRQLQGEKSIEPSLEELDEQKYILETLDEKTTDLLKDYDKTSQQEISDGEIKFDD